MSSPRLDVNQLNLNKKPLSQTQFGEVYQGLLGANPIVAKYFNFNSKNLKKDRSAGNGYEVELKCHEHVSSKPHPNIIKLIGMGRDKKGDFLVIEYVPFSLDVYMRKNPIPNFETILCMMNGLAAAVCFLHNQIQMIHCDIKSSNVMLTSEMQVKLADFGAAQHVEGANKRGMRGSGFWMAPELFEEKSVNSQEADVYAMMITFMEFIAWQEALFLYPMRLSNLGDKVVNENLRPELPAARKAELDKHPSVRDLIKFGLSKEPSERPSALAVTEQLRLLKS